ncbi:MAG: hypothetical protein AAGU11_21625 [Syntrophobacteraceae bacterium]
MKYDEFDIELARASNAPEPEANAERANEILALIDETRLDDAEARLAKVSDPEIKESLANLIDFNRTCLCIPQEDLIAAMSQ